MPTVLPSFSALVGVRECVLSVDATRELAKCANGELVSHDVVRDGIDALLQLKSATYDVAPCDEVEMTRDEVLRSCPEVADRGKRIGGFKEESEEEEEEDEHENDSSSDGFASPPPTERIVRKTRPKRAQKVTKRPAKPTFRPPTIWHHRKSSDTVPSILETPQSKASPPESSDVDEDDGEPAVLHFSCLQCHRAKKRCNRTHPCNRCVSRGMEDECGYPDKHDPKSVLRACLRCWQTKKKCDRKQPGCGKCDKVGVKCMYRREHESETSPVMAFLPTPTLTMTPPPKGQSSRFASDTSHRTPTPPLEPHARKRRRTDSDITSLPSHRYSTRRNSITSVPPKKTARVKTTPVTHNRILRTRK